MYGNAMSPPPGSAPSGPPQSALSSYMANYGARLQSMLAGEAGGGALGAAPVMAMPEQGVSTDTLGPDLYQGYQVGEGARFMPRGAPSPAAAAAQPQTGGNGNGAPAPPAVSAPAASAPAPAQPAPQSALSVNATPQQRRMAFLQSGGGSGGAPRSALAGAAPAGAGASSALDSPGGQGVPQQPGQPGGAQQKPYGFRDLWNDLSTKERKQQTDELANQLKAGRQTINSAYSTMINQLGTRPQTNLSRQDKGMLLMEFGLKMMQHSAATAQGGYGKNFGAAMGAAGAETMQTAFGLRQQKQQQAYNYDRLKQQMAIGHGRDLANLQSRSVLEAGRDFRGMNREDALMARSAFMQNQANGRQQSALTARQNRPTGSGARGGAVARPTAAQENYKLYMDTFGHDAQGKPLTGPALQDAQQSALKYSSSPGHYQLSDAQVTQMANASADKVLNAEIGAQSKVMTPMKPADITAERARLVTEFSQRLRRNGTTGVSAPPASALAPAGNRPPAGAAPPGRPQPSAQDLSYLQAHPEQRAAFQRRFGYLPQ